MSEVTLPERGTPSRIKHVSTLKGRLGWQGLKAEEYRDDGPFVVSSAHFRNDRIVWDMCPHVSWERYRLDANIQLRDGDVLLMKDGAALGKLAFLDHLPGPACLNSHLLLFRPVRDAYSPKFLYYYMTTTFFQEYILIRGTGATFLGVSQETIGNYEIALPPRGAQRAIAALLDRKTAAIDALIAKKERLIDLLREKRQALITQAVTKGFDPNVPMKESGDEWFGSVPEHWGRTRLGYLSAIGNGSTPSREEPDYWSEEGFPWLNSAKVNEETVPEADRFVTPRALRECHLPRVQPGTVLMAITGEGQTRGRAAVLTFEATISQHLAYIAPSARMSPRFLLRQLQARYAWLRNESSGGGSTKGALTCEFLRTVPVTLPPRTEQDVIVARLDEALARGDHLLDRLSQSVDQLREYRQALITAAVTGKVDLSEEAA